tara:strand:+ start:64 stop:459 length:396 start_codon:yes stop_codon:yes gene_type:complete
MLEIDGIKISKNKSGYSALIAVELYIPQSFSDNSQLNAYFNKFIRDDESNNATFRLYDPASNIEATHEYVNTIGDINIELKVVDGFTSVCILISIVNDTDGLAGSLIHLRGELDNLVNNNAISSWKQFPLQ